ncbi:hypothetical protein [Weissella paramesenteroides]|uniref:hypothetical protein n=1 Tax=Weissella paramesenteroides TaxID=1249 RepID=UPI00223BC7C1|nr:hypothetical protein [Weissella paramesenteroides]
MTNEAIQLGDLLDQFNTSDEVGQNRLVYNQQWLRNQRALILLGQEHDAQATVDDYGNVSLDFQDKKYQHRLRLVLIWTLCVKVVVMMGYMGF